MKVINTEHGYDFITLYFEKGDENRLAGIAVYNHFKKIGFEHIELQRKEFRHLPGDVPHFHPDGAITDYWDSIHHFHILYPNEPTQEDWEYLYKHISVERTKVSFERGLPTRRVQENR